MLHLSRFYSQVDLSEHASLPCEVRGARLFNASVDISYMFLIVPCAVFHLGRLNFQVDLNKHASLTSKVRGAILFNLKATLVI